MKVKLLITTIICIIGIGMLTSCSQLFSQSWYNDTYDEDCQGCCPPCGTYYNKDTNKISSLASSFNSSPRSNLDSMLITCPLKRHCKDTFKNDGSASFDSYRVYDCCKSETKHYCYTTKHKKHKYKHKKIIYKK